MRAGRIKKKKVVTHTHAEKKTKKQNKTAGTLVVTRFAPGKEGKHLQAVGLDVSAFSRKTGTPTVGSVTGTTKGGGIRGSSSSAGRKKKNKKRKSKHMAGFSFHFAFLNLLLLFFF